MAARLLAVASLLALGAATRLRRDDPAQVEVQNRIDKMAPVLDRLRGLDPKTFGLLSNMLKQAEGPEAPEPRRGAAFLQYARDAPDEVQAKLKKLGPLVDRLRRINPRMFGALSSIVSQVRPASAKASEPPAEAALEPPASWGGAPDKASMLQRGAAPADLEDGDVSKRIEAMAPVLDRLRGLDPKAFGMLSGMLNQAEGEAAERAPGHQQ